MKLSPDQWEEHRLRLMRITSPLVDLTNKQAMETCERKVQFHAFEVTSSDAGEMLNSRSARFNPLPQRKRPRSTLDGTENKSGQDS